MAQEVFLSHASSDAEIGEAVCERLERAGISCWIAPRNIQPGAEYSAGIIDGIRECQILVVIFTARANASKNVLREIERAATFGKTILPFRVESVEPSREMEFFLSMPQWLDATSGRLDQNIDRLIRVVQETLNRAPEHSVVSTPAENHRSKRNHYSRTVLGVAFTAILLLLAWAASKIINAPRTPGEVLASDPTAGLCLTNLRRYAEALNTAKTNSDSEAKFLKELTLTCPSTQHRYHINKEALANLGYLPDPSSVPLVYESDLGGTPEYPHKAYGIMLFADLHTALIDTAEAKTLSWKLDVKLIEERQIRVGKISCIANMKQIDSAKEQFAMDKGLSSGANVSESDIYPDYVRSFPVCLRGGKYTVGKVGENPKCSKTEEDHVLNY